MFNIQGFYKIKSIVNCSIHKEKIKAYLLSKSVKGTVILSPEGINGTIAGKKSNVNSCIKFIKDKFSIVILIVTTRRLVGFYLFIEQKLKLKRKLFR